MPETSLHPLDRPFRRGASAPGTLKRKFLVVAAVLLVHVGMWLALKVRTPEAEHDPFAGETVLILTKKPPAQAAAPKASAPRNNKTIFIPPKFSPFTPYQPPRATPPDFLLFACAPTNIDRLSREDRARCSAAGVAMMGYNGPRSDVFPKSDVQNPEKWMTQLKEKNAPARVPCVTIVTKSIMPGPGGGGPPKEEIGVSTDPLCALGAVLSLFK